ncbi:hypothetical protein BVG79_00654 [Ketogulonicigenium robustum]|uniref:Uncharacterized protein n=1 Tax=Ketogulonicigenium robustum TaxID=92947 RepID=A0A1W6NXN3_9RHOB|nr:hypothetical protein [Ketogulonicigenium robustum]ARO14006.1 hypothetical protein BVG79_00654 [Ketogulonicigenium robustum]
MKNVFTLATATVLAAVVGTASIAAQPGGFFQTADKIEPGKGLTFDVVNASSPATLEVYTSNGGELGQLVSSQEVGAGATADIRLISTKVPASDLIAQLKINGDVVDSKLIELN